MATGERDVPSGTEDEESDGVESFKAGDGRQGDVAIRDKTNRPRRFCGFSSYKMTVEPVAALFIMTNAIASPQIHALTYDKVCRLHFNSTICDSLSSGLYNDAENLVQTESSYWFLWQHVAFRMPAVLFTFQYGALGDLMSRKFSLVLPSVGFLLGMSIALLCAASVNCHPAWFLLGAGLNGVFGGLMTLDMAADSYISESSSKKQRTLRLSVLEGTKAASSTLSLLLGGLLYDYTTHYAVFILALLLQVLVLIYVFLYIEEPKRLKERSAVTYCQTLKDFLSPARLKETYFVLARTRPNKGRLCLAILLLSSFLAMITHYAMPTLSYLFLRRQNLDMSQTEFTAFHSLGGVLSTIVGFVVIPFLKYSLGVRDSILLVVGLLSSSLSELALSFCITKWMVYTVPFIGMLGQARHTALRSLISKLVDADELGRVFAVLAAFFSVTGILGSFIYNTIYPLTLDIWPGMCFAVGAALSLIPMTMTCWIHAHFSRNKGYHQLRSEGQTMVYAEKGVESLDDSN